MNKSIHKEQPLQKKCKYSNYSYSITKIVCSAYQQVQM